jgi:dTDP-4-dehydrorhamnose reductase
VDGEGTLIMRAAIIGGEGMLGRDLVEAFGTGTFPVGHADADIRDPLAVARILDSTHPEAVVLAAAFHDVPRCESDPTTAFAVNAIGALNVARAAADRRIPLVYVSTDYVFSGELGRRYTERDLPAPVNVYGISKLAGERAVLAAHPGAQVVRVSGLFGMHPCRAKGGRNIVEFILSKLETGSPLRMVADEFAAPTWTYDAARQIRTIVTEGGPGVYHAVNGPGCSWYELALAVRDACGSRTPVEAVGSSAFPSAVRKPPSSILANARLEREGLLRMRSLHLALRGYLEVRQAAMAPVAC